MGIWDTLLGRSASDAANRAAADTYGKQVAAGNTVRQAGDEYRGNMYDIGRDYDPYVQGGGSALKRLLAGLGLEGGDSPEAFASAYRSLPGYQSGLETATTGALRQANASGMGNSSRALLNVGRKLSDYEDMRSGSYLDRLTQQANQGFTATGARTGVFGEGERGRLGAYTGAGQQDFNAAGTIGQGQVAGEQARSDALGRLIGAGTYLAGSFLGGRGGGGSGNNMNNMSSFLPIPKLW
jgi:hypothetical protein